MTLMFIVKVDSAMILIIAGNGKYNKRSLPKAAMICYTVFKNLMRGDIKKPFGSNFLSFIILRTRNPITIFTPKCWNSTFGRDTCSDKKGNPFILS
jgi:hypothetical protein